MRREEFLEKIHKKQYSEEKNNFSEMSSEKAIISVPLNQENPTNSFNELKELVEFLSDNKIDNLAFRDFLIEREFIRKEYIGEEDIYISYNDLYDFLIEQKLIKNENKIKIIRIENEKGEGFYNHFREINKSISDYFDSNTNTSPIVDSYLRTIFSNLSGKNTRAEMDEESEKWIFGFKNKKQLNDWLKAVSDDESQTLKQFIQKNAGENIFISEYEIKESDTLTTNYQSIFKKEKSKLSNRLTFNEFLKLEELKIIESSKKREDFINRIHYENYQIDNDFDNIISKQSIVLFELVESDLMWSFNKFTQKIKNLTGFDFSNQNFKEFLQQKDFIKEDYFSGEKQIYLNYNDIYDFLINENIIKNDKKIEVTRIETKNGIGFYNYFSDKDINLGANFEDKLSQKSSPLDDQVLKTLFGTESGIDSACERKEINKEWFFGFKNNSQFFDWLEKKSEDGKQTMLEFIQSLAGEELYVSKYEVLESDTLSTDLQSVFIKNKSTLKSQLNFNQFIEKENLDILNNLNNLKNKEKNKKKIRNRV